MAKCLSTKTEKAYRKTIAQLTDKSRVFCARSHKIILKPQLITILPFPPREKANLLEFLAQPISRCYLPSHEMDASLSLSQAYLGTSGLESNTQDVRLKNKSVCLSANRS